RHKRRFPQADGNQDMDHLLTARVSENQESHGRHYLRPMAAKQTNYLKKRRRTRRRRWHGRRTGTGCQSKPPPARPTGWRPCGCRVRELSAGARPGSSGRCDKDGFRKRSSPWRCLCFYLQLRYHQRRCDNEREEAMITHFPGMPLPTESTLDITIRVTQPL